MLFSPSLARPLVCITWAVVACGSSIAETPVVGGFDGYIAAIEEVQMDLDAGRIAFAKQKLKATDKLHRSFEYNYLLACCETASPGEPAPDLVQTIDVPPVKTRYGVLNAADRQLAFVCHDGAVRVHDLANPRTQEMLVTHEGGGAVWTGAFSRDGRTFIAGFESGDVVVWNAKSWERRIEVSVGEKPVRQVAVAPDGSAFVAEGESSLELWSLAESPPMKIADVGERYRFGEGLAFSPRGDWIATGGMFDISLHDARTGKKTRSLKHASYTMGLEFSPDGALIASAPRANVNKFLAVFDVARGNMEFNVGPFPCYVHGGIFTSDGKRIVSTACAKVPFLQLFDSATGKLVFSLARESTGAKPAVSADGQLLGWSEPSGYQFIDLTQKQGSAN